MKSVYLGFFDLTFERLSIERHSLKAPGLSSVKTLKACEQTSIRFENNWKAFERFENWKTIPRSLHGVDQSFEKFIKVYKRLQFIEDCLQSRVTLKTSRSVGRSARAIRESPGNSLKSSHNWILLFQHVRLFIRLGERYKRGDEL